MKISLKKWWQLSDITLEQCRDIDEELIPKGGWQGWSTSGMRMMTNGLLDKLLKELDIEVDMSDSEENREYWDETSGGEIK